MGAEDRFLLPLVGSSRTVHTFLKINPEQWFTINEIAQKTELRETSVQSGLTLAGFDPRIVRRKRPQDEGRSIDEYSFLPLLKRK